MAWTLVPAVRNVWRRPAKLSVRDYEPGHDCNTKLHTGRKFNSSIVRARAENYTEWMPSGMKLLFPPLPPTRNGNPGYVRRRVKHRFEISGVHDPAVSGRFVPANSLDFPHKFSTLLPPQQALEECTWQIGQTAKTKNDPMLDYGTGKNTCFMCW